MFANRFGYHNNVCCGLVTFCQRQNQWGIPIQSLVPIPLASVNVSASVVHAVGQVEVNQIYVNRESQPIEAIYYFPVNPDGAVTHFQAELEGRIIKGTVKPQEEARHDYIRAVQNQTTAFLGEETKADIFKVRVGFLKPFAEVKVTIGYVTEVKNEPGSNSIRFYLPTTIAPRYVSPTQYDEKAHDIQNMAYYLSSPAPLSLKVAVSLQGGIKSIQSHTHRIVVQNSGPIPQNEVWHKAVVELAGVTTDMDRDFVLDIVPQETHKPRLYSEKSENGTTALMIHLLPSFKLDEQKSQLIFVLDRSGSMMGARMELAKRALLLFLHSMPEDCYFNIVSFGSSYEFMFPVSAKYNNESLQYAVEHTKKLQANMGGTEIMPPLRDIFRRPGVDGYLRQLFILTDGEVANTDAVLGIVQANSDKARVFSLGIGEGASHHLVEGLAKAGGGTSAFVSSNESMEKKVLNQLKNGLQPSLTDIELEWEGLPPEPELPEVVPVRPVEANKPPPIINKEKTLFGYNKPVDEVAEISPPTIISEVRWKDKQSPKRIPPVYDGSQMVVFGLFKGDRCPTSVTIKAQSPDGPLTISLPNTPSNEVEQTGMLHRLAAVKLIRELELEISALQFQGHVDLTKRVDDLKREIVDLACQNGITSKYTSYVAIDVKENKPYEDNWVLMHTRNVPSQVPQGHAWPGGGFGVTPMMQQPQCVGQYDHVNFRNGMGGSGVVPFGGAPPTTGQGFNFGGQQQPQQQTSLFGGSAQSFGGVPPNHCSSGQVFGGTPTQYFGAPQPVEGRTSGQFSFGGPPAQSAPSIFGAPQPVGGSSQLFGQPTQAAPSAFSFGFPGQVTTTAQSQSGPSPKPLFGSTSMSQPAPALASEPQSFGGGGIGSTSPLMELVTLQSFDGSFTLNEKFASVVGKPVGEIREGAIQFTVQDKIFATALAISVFLTKMTAEKDVWELIVFKARKWLGKSLKPEQVDDVIAAAATFLGSA